MCIPENRKGRILKLPAGNCCNKTMAKRTKGQRVKRLKDQSNLFASSLFFLLTFSPFLLLSPANSSKLELLHEGNFIENTEIQKLNGQDYISLKAIALLLKGKTQWYPIAGQVALQAKNRRALFNVDSKQVVLGNKKTTMTAPLRIVKNQAYAPLHFFITAPFSDFFDQSLYLDSQKRSLHLKSRANFFFPRIFSRSDLTRVVLQSETEIQPTLQKKDKTFLIEIPNAKIGEEEELKLRNSVVERLKLIHERKGALLKIELLEDVTSYSLFRKNGAGPWILEMQSPSPLMEIKPSSIEEGSLPPSSVAPPTFTPDPRALQPIRKIVVDAGHGGHDSGAKGPRGTEEKEMNLLIALELAEILTREGYEVLLTRSDDTFVPLRERTLFANQNRADLFISIHCNASPKKRRVKVGKKSGFEIYFLAEEASDIHAEAAAEFENAVIELEGSGTPQKQKLHELLLSMARTEFINESALLCHKIAKAVERRVPIENRGVKQADFHVLHGAQMPSVLVESAFIDYPAEEKKLRTKKFRSAIVEAIFAGILDYEKELQLLRRR